MDLRAPFVKSMYSENTTKNSKILTITNLLRMNTDRSTSSEFETWTHLYVHASQGLPQVSDSNLLRYQPRTSRSFTVTSISFFFASKPFSFRRRARLALSGFILSDGNEPSPLSLKLRLIVIARGIIIVGITGNGCV